MKVKVKEDTLTYVDPHAHNLKTHLVGCETYWGEGASGAQDWAHWPRAHLTTEG